MSKVFLGPWPHWLIAAIIVGLGWYAGTGRLHVSLFNGFIVALIVLTIIILIAVLRTSPPEQQVTRDPIDPPE